MTDEEYIQIIRKKLTPARFRHSMNVAAEAKKLAERYGADSAKAYTAGILHDIMKDEPKPIQLQTIEKTDIILTAVERKNPKLWHAIAGMVYIRDVLHVDDNDILLAVRYHTTAREGMSLLEKIVYIADFISADRDYDGVDMMRSAANESLEKAMLEGMKYSIADLAQSEQLIHTDTVNAYNEIVGAKS